MKESVKIEDYVKKISQMIEEAKAEGKEYVDINAGELHKMMSKKPTLPSCCMAMRKMKQSNDQVISEANTKSGYGVALTIRYFVAERDEAEVMEKRRGRPKGSKNSVEKIRAKKKTVNVEESVEEYLSESGIAYEKKDNMILADGAYGKWLILLNEHKRGPKASFSSKVMKLLSYYDDSIEKYSLALKTDANMDSSWKEISDIAKKRLNMTLLKITPAGNIKEI